jgi:hypothetical protein
MSRSDVVNRFARTLALVVVLSAAAAFLAQPARPRLALGVVGGGVLAAVSVWAIRGAVRGVAAGVERREIGPNLRRAALVKFFTRHAILAVTAYVMMLRLQLDPVGLVVGVSALWVAAAVEAVRSNPK